MFIRKFHQSFHSFIHISKDFNDNEKDNLHKIFKLHTIKKIFNFAIILFVWAFVASWIDIFLFSGASIMSIQEMHVSPHFYNSFLTFIIVNAVLKFIFILSFTRKMKFVKIYHVVLGIIPYFGSVFIIAVLLNHEKLFLSALKKYLSFIKKKKNLLKIFQKKNQE